ncbi:MAG: hypothetical protein HYX67_15665 [Candidatus Melainabacteria bacterium]|nr:hypothetical protein [Candidatus Melainabacteria bacterium]
MAKQYFPDIKADLELRLNKVRSFRPYVHPRAPQISAESVWARFSPAMMQRYKEMKDKSGQPSLETVPLLCQLYLNQASLPSDTVKQILLMQQNQQGVQPDPILANTDLSLYGFKTVEDWFGPQFISLVGQFISNAAQIAEDRGYAVKTAEVRSDLFQNIYKGYQQISRNGQLKPEEAEQYFQMKMHALGMDENMLLGAWKKVMLFRRLFEDGSGSILVDPLAYKHFSQFAGENAQVSLYQLPSALQFGDFRSMLKFQLYLESVASDPSQVRADLNLPQQLASLEPSAQRAPEFVVTEQPEKVRQALQAATAKTSTVGLRMKGGNLPFAGSVDSGELNLLLEGAALKGQPANAASDRLSFYSPDAEHYYQVHVLERDAAKKVLTFEEASKDGTLDKLLDKRLEEAYPEVRKKDTRNFQVSNGGFKPYKEVKDQIGKLLYSDLLKAIEDNYQAEYGMLPGNAGDLPLAFYSNARLLPYMKAAQKHLKAHPEDASLIKNAEAKSSLATQWLLEKTDQVLERSSEVLFSKEEMFTLSANQWSSVKAGERGAIAFYFVREKGKNNQQLMESIEQGHQILAYDAKRDMVIQILQKIQQKKAIDLSQEKL